MRTTMNANRNFESLTVSLFPSQYEKLIAMQAADPAQPSLSYLVRKLLVEDLGVAKPSRRRSAKRKSAEAETESSEGNA